MSPPIFTVYSDQVIDLWVMQRDDNTVQLAADSGDNGFLILTNKQAEDLERALLTLRLARHSQ